MKRSRVAEALDRHAARTADLLDSVATRLERTGWCRGRWGPREGPNCLMGALRYEAPIGGWGHVSQGYDALVDALGASDTCSLSAWNDSQTDVAEVTGLLRRAAEQMRAERPC